MTSIVTTVRTHRLSFAVVGALAALVLVAAVLLFKTTSAHELHNHLVNSYHHVPKFVRTLLGAGPSGPEPGDLL